eukprot:6212206-Pleurochrysis_carterae.AAC.1
MSKTAIALATARNTDCGLLEPQGQPATSTREYSVETTRKTRDCRSDCIVHVIDHHDTKSQVKSFGHLSSFTASRCWDMTVHTTRASIPGACCGSPSRPRLKAD